MMCEYKYYILRIKNTRLGGYKNFILFIYFLIIIFYSHDIICDYTLHKGIKNITLTNQ